MHNAANNSTDREGMCWTTSAAATGVEAALWAIAASVCRLAAVTERYAKNFGPEADAAAPLRAVETLAVAVDNIADAISDATGERIDTKTPPH